MDLAGGGSCTSRRGVPSKVVANRVWDAIDEGRSQLSDLQARDRHRWRRYLQPSGYQTSPATAFPKISKLFYGDANKYNEIAQANGIPNPDRIQAGQQINLPALG